MISLFSNTIQIYTFKGGEMVTKIPQKMTGERKGNVGGDYDNPQFNYNSLQLKVIICDNV